ncbi:MAG: MBOAT family O-acyltransferase [Suilimivivens sp.]
MSIISFSFLFFVCFVFISYYIVPEKCRWVVLLLANVIFFIAGCNIKLFLCMLLPVFLTYYVARLIEKCDELLSEKKIKIIVCVTILFDVIVLIIYKELNFFITNYNLLSRLLGSFHAVEAINFMAPLGISYFTLMLVGYLLDVYWKKVEAQRNFAKFITFIIFFPVMVSGPILRYGEMKEQLYLGRKFHYESFCFGIQRVLWGLFKKMVVADRLGIIVATIYDSGEEYVGFYIIVGVIAYTLQVYMDFSGYIDIVIGVTELFNIKLPENFNTPFCATNLSEIWRRWHMTLGFWAKDYILYPILKSDFMQNLGEKTRRKFGRKWGKRVPTWMGMLVVWFTVGFWHGGAWKYVFGSGISFFLMIAGGQLLEPSFDKIKKYLKINTECASWRLLQRIRTFGLFSASISLGRAVSLGSGFAMLKRAFVRCNPWIFFDGSLYNLGLDTKDICVMIIGLLTVLVVSVYRQKESVRVQLQKQNMVCRWFVFISLFWVVLIFGQYGPSYDASTFIYGQF